MSLVERDQNKFMPEFVEQFDMWCDILRLVGWNITIVEQCFPHGHKDALAAINVERSNKSAEVHVSPNLRLESDKAVACAALHEAIHLLLVDCGFDAECTGPGGGQLISDGAIELLTERIATAVWDTATASKGGKNVRNRRHRSK